MKKIAILLSLSIVLAVSAAGCSDTSSTPQLDNNTTDNNGGGDNGGGDNSDNDTDIVGNSKFGKKTRDQICSKEYGDKEGCSEGLKQLSFIHSKKDPELAVYVSDNDKIANDDPNYDWKTSRIPMSHNVIIIEYDPVIFQKESFILLYKLKMQDLGNGKNKIKIIEDLRSQKGAEGFDLTIDENVKYHYADGEVDIINGITVNKGYIKDNPSYFNDKYKPFPICPQPKDQPKEIYQTKAGMCNNEGEGCFDRAVLPFSDNFQGSYYVYAYNETGVYFNNRTGKSITFLQQQMPELPQFSNYIPLYKIEKVTNGDSYDYKITDLKKPEMTGFQYKIIKNVSGAGYNPDFSGCIETIYNYLIIEKGHIPNNL